MKATDKGSGVGEIKISYKNGKEKYKKYSECKKSVTLTYSKKEWNKIEAFYVKDRAGNRY